MAEAAVLRFQRFDEFDAASLYAVLKLRFDVFVLEQASLYPELDGRDAGALHLVAGAPEAPTGTLRILDLDGEAAAPIWIGRIAVAPAARGSGLGRRMIDAALAEIALRAPGRTAALGAQLRMERYYESFGFRRSSEVYDDGGIDHVDMVRPPA
ncbi:MAG: GNAT family N-acetyltransferase [Pseudomonadota bacterium]